MTGRFPRGRARAPLGRTGNLVRGSPDVASTIPCYDVGRQERRAIVQTQSAAAANAEAYDSRPWLERYPRDVPRSIDYSEQSIWELLEEIVAQHGDRPAFVFQDYVMSFSRLLAHADRFSAALARTGV